MRLAIISDVHANVEALHATLQDIAHQQVSHLVCLGDIVGYNTSPGECVTLLREHEAICVAGNHDRAVTGQITVEGFSATAAGAVAWTRERLSADVLEFLAGLPLQASIEGHLVAVHGALRVDGACERTYVDDDERRRECFDALARHPSRARICAHGHTHRVGTFELRGELVRAYTGDEVHLRDDAYYLINPGTIGQPRRTRDRRATYMVLDTTRGMLVVRRVAYDHTVPTAKTRRAGLAPRASTTVRGSIRAAARWSAHSLGVYGFVQRLRDRRGSPRR